jgi:tetratricopeptide (TPR) repeat protein
VSNGHQRLAAAALVALACACGSPTVPASRPPTDTLVHPVTLPDLSRAHEAVQQQARDRFDAIEHLREDPSAADRDLAEAYGAFGMILQAAGLLDAAEPAYLNARALAPLDHRWAYYLGHLYTDRGALDEAEAAFDRVLALRPDDLATLIWLGRLRLGQGRPDDADATFRRAQTVSPDAVAVLAGLGRASLDLGRHADAASYLERALAIDPEADSLHAPLAQAYRALGQIEKAEPHLRQWSSRDVLVPDPLNQQLDMLLESGLAYELRGVRALEAKHWETAAAYFTRGLELTPDNGPLRRSLQHKLGTALHLGGDAQGALVHFEAAARAAPEGAPDEAAARARYSLAIVRLADGRAGDAIEHLEAAIRHQPAYAEARVVLAEALRRTGHSARALPHYEEALRLDPSSAQARLGQALALIRLDRHARALEVLNEAVRIHPGHPELAHLLARLLAVSPDGRLRDGNRAMALLEPLLQQARTTELGETLAMALAETGDYDRAVDVQRSILRVARQGAAPATIQRMEANLRLYEGGRPTRTLWADD